MTNKWLLSGHNTQETSGVARPVTVSMTERGLNHQIQWFLEELAEDTSDFDPTLRPTQVIEGYLYLNINYYARNMGSVVPFKPESVGASAELVEEIGKIPLRRLIKLPQNYRRIYEWTKNYYQNELPPLDAKMREMYWELQESTKPPLRLIWTICETKFYRECRQVDRAHIVTALTITTLDSLIRQYAPELLGLFVGEATAISRLGQRIWELREVAERCGPEVRQQLMDGVVDLHVYEAMPEAALLVKGINDFLKKYGHRGFRYEADFETERLADYPEHILIAIAGQLKQGAPPSQRAAEAKAAGQQALQKKNPLTRYIWRRVLDWGSTLISWREQSKSSIALRQAIYGLSARHLAHYFYPQEPDDILMFYRLSEFLNFARSRGREKVPYERLTQRRAEFELHQKRPAPPELIWYTPETHHWESALADKVREDREPSENNKNGEQATQAKSNHKYHGIAVSAGSGPVEGIALVTNDPVEAGYQLISLKGPVILVTRLTDPVWSSLFGRLTAVVTELGNVISHAAIVARENGLPAVVGVPNITQHIRTGQRISVDGYKGTIEVLN